MKTQKLVLLVLALSIFGCANQPIKNEKYLVLFDEKTKLQVSKPQSWKIMSKEQHLEKILSQRENLSAMDIETQIRAVKRAVDASIFIIAESTDKDWGDAASIDIRTLKSPIANQEMYLRTIASTFKKNFPELEITDYKTFANNQLTYPCISFKYDHKDPINVKSCLFRFTSGDFFLAVAQHHDSQSYAQPALDKILQSISEKNEK
jgi:hypothetical protein